MIECKPGLKNVTWNNYIIYTEANSLAEVDRSSTYTYDCIVS